MAGPRSPLRRRLVLSFALVIGLGVLLSALAAATLIGDAVIQQAQEKVRLDLNTARELYAQAGEHMRTVVRLTAGRFFLRAGLRAGDREGLAPVLDEVRVQEGFDLLTLLDARGIVFVRAHQPAAFGDALEDAVLAAARAEDAAVTATEVYGAARLAREGEALAARARIDVLATPRARARPAGIEERGLMLCAAAPVHGEDGTVAGVLLGARLLNRGTDLVDRVKDIVYRGARHGGRDVGSATIFLDDLRIATNVLTGDGERAIGTEASEEVYRQVVERGVAWVGRAFVVDAWCRTAYEPLRDHGGRVVGMLYVGMLEAPYVELRNRVLAVLFAIAAGTILLLAVIARRTARHIVAPIRDLAHAADRIAAGDLSQRVHWDARDETGTLARSFDHMAEELQRAQERYDRLTHTLEEQVERRTGELRAAQESLARTERLSALGKLAAGTAHEINNPLTSILINSHLLAEKLGEDPRVQEHMRLVLEETERCITIVTGLLQFARQTPPVFAPVDLNALVRRMLLLVEGEARGRGVRVTLALADDLPEVLADAGKVTQVFTNLVVNALDAMAGGGDLTIRTRRLREPDAAEVSFTDTGPGIPPEILDRIFDPFFTTKGTRGTGLGLSISYGICEQHGATIEARSEAGEGTTMVVRFPLRATLPEEPSHVAADPHSRGG